ncbi:MAG: AsmA family protein [Rhizobiaceae bacterium]|nr:AsmA family protein [Rhizobiaceae bacterium]
MLARLFVFVGSLIVLALMAALIGPYFIDWTSYRADFEREASTILGREVKVNGAAKARILPFPSVTFSNVTVRNASGDGFAMTVDEFSMDAELAPFLSGDVLIFDMRLVRPKATIVIDSEGRVDWALRPSVPFDARNITLEHVAITDGEVQIHSGNGTSRTLGDIDAVVAARTLAGPWRAEGTLRLDGREAAVSGSTGVADAEGLRLKLKVEPTDLPIIAELEGLASSNGGVIGYKGTFHANERLAAPKGDRKGGAARAQQVGNRVSGAFDLNDKRLLVQEFRFEAGPAEDPYVANGNASVDFGIAPHFSVSATGAQIRLDDEAEQGGTSGSTMAERISTIETVLASLPLPVMPGAVDIRLPAIVAGDTTIRDVALAATTADDGWNIDRLTATLPGRTTLESNGALEVRPALSFDGRMLLAVGQPSGFAAWLANDIDAPVRRLSKAGFEANVQLSSQRQVLTDLQLIVGGARFNGSVTRSQPEGAMPHLAVNLDGGPASRDEAAALLSLFLDENRQNRLASEDTDLKLRVTPIGDEPYNAESLDLALRLSGQTVEIDRLSVTNLAGASLAATGSVEQLGAQPRLKLDASLLADDLEPFIGLLAAGGSNRVASWLQRSARDYTGLLKDTNIDFLIDASAGEGGQGDLRLTAKGIAGGTAIDTTLASSGMWGQPDKATIDLTSSLKADDGSAFLALAGVPVLPLGLASPAQADIRIKGVPSADMQTNIAVKADADTANFAGTMSLGNDDLRIRGLGSLSAADVEPWLMTAGVAFPGVGTGTEVGLKAEVDYGKGLLVLGNMSGRISERAVSGDLNVELHDGLPNVTGTLVADEIDLAQAAQMVLGPNAFDSDGGNWPSAAFQPDTNAPVRADLDISAATLLFGDDFALHDAVLSLQLDDEGLKVPELSARFNEGTLTGLFDLKNSAADGLFTGQFRLAGARLENVLPKLGVNFSALSGSVDLSASLTANGKSVSGMMASLAGSGSASLRDVSLQGIDPTAFPELVKEADRVGRDVDAARTAQFAPSIVRQGVFEAGNADAAFTVAAGVVRMPPLHFDRADSLLSGELKVDLNRFDVEAKGTMAYKPGDEALVGSEPTVGLVLSGPLDAPVLAVDTQQLGQFLTQRALEIEQARVEAMQAALLEKQRLRREANYFAALDLERKRAAEEQRRREEEAKRKAEEDARLKAEAEARAKAEEAARLQAEEQARKLAEEEAKRKAEEAERARREQQSAPVVPAQPAPQPSQGVGPNAPGGPPPATPPASETSVPDVAPAPQPKPQPPAAQPAPPPQPAPRQAQPPANAFPPPPKPSTITDFLRSLGG